MVNKRYSIFYKNFEDLGLSVRVQKFLRKNGVRTTGELVLFSENELKRFSWYNPRYIQEIKGCLKSARLKLKNDGFDTYFALSKYRAEEILQNEQKIEIMKKQEIIYRERESRLKSLQNILVENMPKEVILRQDSIVKILDSINKRIGSGVGFKLSIQKPTIYIYDELDMEMLNSWLSFRENNVCNTLFFFQTGSESKSELDYFVAEINNSSNTNYFFELNLHDTSNVEISSIFYDVTSLKMELSELLGKNIKLYIRIQHLPDYLFNDSEDFILFKDILRNPDVVIMFEGEAVEKLIEKLDDKMIEVNFDKIVL